MSNPPYRLRFAALCVGAVLAGCAPGGDPTPAAEPDDTAAPADDEATEPTEPAEQGADRDAVEDEEVAISETVVAGGLEAPWAVAFTPAGQAYVTERDSGRLLRVGDDGRVEQVQTFDVNPQSEGGLLGLAVSPDFDADGLLYAYYTTGTDNRVVRFAPGEEAEEVLTGIPRAGVHNGGRIAFGPDGMLYVSTGDAGSPEQSADGGTLAGKILRLDPDGSVPDDNPTDGSPVFASGIRNPQGLAWDAGGSLYITEFGPDVDDAVLRVEPGSDQGWGADTADAPAGERPFPDPVAVRQPPDASWSGVAILADGAIPQWEGDLFATALRGERLWRFPLDGGEPEERYVGEYGRLRAVAQAPDGSLWLLTSNRDGRGDPGEDDDRIIRVGPDA